MTEAGRAGTWGESKGQDQEFLDTQMGVRDVCRDRLAAEGGSGPLSLRLRLRLFHQPNHHLLQQLLRHRGSDAQRT